MEMRYKASPTVSGEVAVRLGYQDKDYLTFAELRGSKDDVVDVLITGLLVFAVGALIFAMLRG